MGWSRTQDESRTSRIRLRPSSVRVDAGAGAHRVGSDVGGHRRRGRRDAGEGEGEGHNMRAIVESSLRFRGLVMGLAAAMVLVGLVQLRTTPVDVVPEFSPPYVEVQTEALGLSAAEVEQLITVPLEADLLAGVAWLDRIESQSVPGLSSVVLYFKPGTDLLPARQGVAARVTQAPGLPPVS